MNKVYYEIYEIFGVKTEISYSLRFICIVEDEKVAKDFCNRHNGCEYKKIEVEE